MSASKSAVHTPLADPVLAALAAAGQGDPSLLTPEDRAVIEANRRSGKRGIPQSKIEAMLEERRRRGE